MNNAQQLLDLAEIGHAAYGQYTNVGRMAEGQIFMPPASRVAPGQKFQGSQNASLSAPDKCVDGIKCQHRQQTEEPNADPS